VVMSQERTPPRPRQGPPPLPTRVPEWVGPDENRRDVSTMSDRAVAVTSLDLVTRLTGTMVKYVDRFEAFARGWEEEKVALLRELPEHARRLDALERREPLQSSHDWKTLMSEAGDALSKRVKDPRDRLDSDRARQIALEVVEGVKTVDDAKAFRTWKTRGRGLIIEAVKGVAIAVAGAVAAHYGWR
jgi:hypothetical protein